MKHERSDTFIADYKRLSAQERVLFRDAVRRLNAAFARRGPGQTPGWPDSLRVKRVRGAPGVWEMTWSFSGPDGRATFALMTIDGEPVIRWRRIGDHRIFDSP